MATHDNACASAARSAGHPAAESCFLRSDARGHDDASRTEPGASQVTRARKKRSDARLNYSQSVLL
jgi:hypothetical protein